MFQFTGFPSWLTPERYVFNITGCPIRTSADQCSFATPRSFSQLTTSFIVSESLGIHHTLLFYFLFLFTFFISTLFYSRVRHSNPPCFLSAHLSIHQTSAFQIFMTSFPPVKELFTNLTHYLSRNSFKPLALLSLRVVCIISLLSFSSPLWKMISFTYCRFVDLSICRFVTFNFQLLTFNFQLLTSFKWRIRESNP